VVATHFYAEHTLRELERRLSRTAKAIRARAQQRDIDEFGIVPNFSGRFPVHTELLQNTAHRRADEIFDNEKVLDLGGVRAGLEWLGGGTHTNSDTIVFVVGDGVLFAGDPENEPAVSGFRRQTSRQRSCLASQP
jgi:glyoxylase-like metal-dependent hydrolase (beta-lactamase superfamily II)